MWNSKSQYFGSCFQWLVLTGASHLIFVVLSAFLLGIASRKSCHPSGRSKLGMIRLLLCYLHAAVAIVSVIMSYTLRNYHPPAFVLSRTLTFTTWLVCALLCHKILSRSRKRQHIMKKLSATFILILASSSIQLYNYVHWVKEDQPKLNSNWYIPAYFGLNLLFFCTLLAGSLFPSAGYSRLGRQLPSLASAGIQSPTNRSGLPRYPEEDALLGTHIDSYDSYTFGGATITSDSILGWAEEEASIFSKMFFHWVNPLMKKGEKFMIKKADDLFLPPLNLDTKMIKEIFQSIIRLQKLSSHSHFNKSQQRIGISNRKATLEDGDEGKRMPLKISLIKALYRAFGAVFMAIGLLKFLADCLVFAGPVLLNCLVSFMENKKVSGNHPFNVC